MQNEGLHVAFVRALVAITVVSTTIACGPELSQSPMVIIYGIGLAILGPNISRSSHRRPPPFVYHTIAVPCSNPEPDWSLFIRTTMGCSVLGRGAEPLVRTQFLEHPPTLNFGANRLKKWIQHPQKPPIPFLSPHNPHHGGGFWGGVKELEHS